MQLPRSVDGAVQTRATYTYKTVGECAIRADVYARPGPEGRPVILWLHGGALMLGNRKMLPPEQASLYLDAGYTVVAADYRLAPESKLPDILADVQDAARWVWEDGPRLFGVDGERLAVIGHSAGGYLTLLAGCHARPRPRALVAFYGYGDVVGPWYSEPSPFYCRQPLVGEDEARSVVGVTPLSEPPLRGSAGFDPDRDRGRFYLYCRQRGLWPRSRSGPRSG
jgi:acetyl esterase/lipase